jgi:hypothetical protein
MPDKSIPREEEQRYTWEKPAESAEKNQKVVLLRQQFLNNAEST